MASADPPRPNLLRSLLARESCQQFIKFCIVGLSSTAISSTVFGLLLYVAGLQARLHGWLASWPDVQAWATRYDVHVQLAALIAFLFAVSNGFFWNSRWTFRRDRPLGGRRRYARFVLVNGVGLTLNQIIVFGVNGLLTAGRPKSEMGIEPLIAFVVATGLVAFWNFLANKHWTFRR